MAALKKGSKAAKDFMAKIRAAKGKTKPKKVGATKILVKKKQSGGSNRRFDKLVQADPAGKRKTAKTHYANGKKITHSTIYTETRKNRSDKGKLLGITNSICGLPTFKDKDAAREIEIYAENDGDLYRQQRRPILQNLSKKHKKGTYKIELAAKLWRYFIDSAMKKYHKEFGGRGKWSDLLSTSDRQILALQFAQETKDEFDLGNYTE
jgi:hypothetical protein